MAAHLLVSSETGPESHFHLQSSDTTSQDKLEVKNRGLIHTLALPLTIPVTQAVVSTTVRTLSFLQYKIDVRLCFPHACRGVDRAVR